MASGGTLPMQSLSAGSYASPLIILGSTLGGRWGYRKSSPCHAGHLQLLCEWVRPGSGCQSCSSPAAATFCLCDRRIASLLGVRKSAPSSEGFHFRLVACISHSLNQNLLPSAC